MSTTISTTGRFLKGAAAATAITVSLGAATLATVEPAQAGYYRHGYHFAHRGFHPYGWGFHHHGFAYRPAFRYGYHPFAHRDGFHGYGFRPAYAIAVPFYGYHHRIHHAWGPYGWHHRCI